MSQKKNRVDRAIAFVESLPASDRFLLKSLFVLFTISFFWLLLSTNAATLVEVPDRGGTLREGIIGTPRFANPVLAVTNADQDLSALVYASLMTLGPDGTLVPNAAESVRISDDGLVYTVRLRSDIVFHDDAPLTTDDVIFTVSRVQDPAVKSPLRASWEGVRMERTDDREMRFILSEPYEPFIENLTLGILPKHVWEQAASEEMPFSQYNSEPIGAGPYKIREITRNSSGIPESYELTANTSYFGKTPKIETLILHFYPSEDDLADAIIEGTVDNASGLSDTAIARILNAHAPVNILSTPLPRTFSLFFNQNTTPLLRESAVRRALERVAPRTTIVETVLGGYGEPVVSPIPPGFGIETPKPAGEDVAALDEAREILRDAGWRFSEEAGAWEKQTDDGALTLSFSIATVNTPVFEETAHLLKQRFAELGVPVDVKQFEQSDLVQTVIRPRQYETLLFGTVVGRELDFYSFWHSSQRNDPGLNVALYANITTDTLLSDARTERSNDERKALYRKFADELHADMPAIFLYVPSYTYVTTPEVRNVALTGLARGSERFSRIYEWYMEKDSVWPFFARESFGFFKD